MRCRLVVGVLLLFHSAAAAADVRSAESIARWREDLRVFRAELPRRHHRDLAFHLPPAELQRLVDALERDLPTLQDHEIKVRLAAIVARLGDRHGHTRVSLTNSSAGFHVLPLNLFSYTDGLFIRAASKDLAEAVGARVLRIGGTAAAEALTRAQTIAAADNPMSRIGFAQELLSVPEILRALRIVDDGAAPDAPVAFEIETPDGRRSTIRVSSLEKLDAVQWVDVRDQAKARPLSRRYPPRNPAAEYIPAKFYWYEFVPESRILYVNYSAVANSPDQTVAAFFDEVLQTAAARNAAKIAIDVRWNGGGNNMLNRAIFTDIAQHEKTFGSHGRLFVIIGRQTFSAAQNFVNYLAANTEAVFVGEPSGGSPNHYGDSTGFTLPNSRLVVRAATLWWQDGHPAEKRTWIAPHIAAEVSSKDDREGRDPAMEAIAAFVPEPSLSSRLRDALLRGGKSEAQKVAREWLADPRYKYQNIEQTMTNVGVALYGEQRTDLAVAIFELSSDLHPRSAAALEALGRAYAAANRKDDAIAAYEKALAIDPGAVTVLDRLDKLRVTP